PQPHKHACVRNAFSAALFWNGDSPERLTCGSSVDVCQSTAFGGACAKAMERQMSSGAKRDRIHFHYCRSLSVTASRKTFNHLFSMTYIIAAVAIGKSHATVESRREF